MAATETIKLSPALQRFLEEGSEDETEDARTITTTLNLGELDITTNETSLRGKTISVSEQSSRA